MSAGQRRVAVVVGAVLLAQFAGLCVYSFHLYRRFDLSLDFAIFGQAWFLIGHGHLNPADTVYVPTIPFIRSHFELAMWPLALIGRVWPSPYSLLVYQDAVLVGIEAATLAWVSDIVHQHRLTRSRDRAPRWLWHAAVLMALVALLVDPWIYETASFDFHLEPFAVLLVVLAGRDLYNGRSRRCFLWALPALLFGDVIGLYLVGLGIIGLAVWAVPAATPTARSRRRRGSRPPGPNAAAAGPVPGLALVALGIGWLGLLSAFGLNQASALGINYGYLAGVAPGTKASLGAIIKGIIRHPSRLGTTLGRSAAHIYGYPAAAGVVGLASAWGLVMAVVVLIPNALNSDVGYIEPTSSFQSLVVIPLVLIGTVQVLLWLTRLGGGVQALRWGAAVLALAALGQVGALGAMWLPKLAHEWLGVGPAEAAALSVGLDRIPANAEVVAPEDLLGRFGLRRSVYAMVDANQTVPVTAREVAFVFAVRHGIPGIPPAAQAADAAGLVKRMHARVLVDRSGVEVVLWPADGRRHLTLGS